MSSTPTTIEEALEEAVELEPIATEDQQAAIDAFFGFMLTNEKFFHLSGGAGVGKTFTLNKIMTEGMDCYERTAKLMGIEQTIFDIKLTATTNKAAEVLTLATGKNASTIHTALGLRVKEDFNTGKQYLSITPNTMVIKNTLIIVDECSMIDSDLYDLMMKYTHQCKFLFTGDHCQMAPVMERLSRIYDDKNNFAHLTKPMRNSGQPALVELCAQLRQTVEDGIFRPIKEVPGVIDYLDGAAMTALVNATYIDPNVDSRILCYRNSEVIKINDYIRKIRGLPAYFCQGDNLISAGTYSPKNDKESKLSVEQEVAVLSTPKGERTITVFGYTFNAYSITIKPIGKPAFSVMVPSDPNHFASCIRDAANKKQWAAYFELKQAYPDLRMRDACTVYKAQGSTYESAIVNLSDISTCTHADQVARMLYVGCSRPKSRLYLYGQLKDAYRGY